MLVRCPQAVALSLQRAWRGKKGREKAALLRAIGLRRHGAAITTQNVYVKGHRNTCLYYWMVMGVDSPWNQDCCSRHAASMKRTRSRLARTPSFAILAATRSTHEKKKIRFVSYFSAVRISNGNAYGHIPMQMAVLPGQERAQGTTTDSRAADQGGDCIPEHLENVHGEVRYTVCPGVFGYSTNFQTP